MQVTIHAIPNLQIIYIKTCKFRLKADHNETGKLSEVPYRWIDGHEKFAQLIKRHPL